jgi:hypothetical protein
VADAKQNKCDFNLEHPCCEDTERGRANAGVIWALDELSGSYRFSLLGAPAGKTGSD